MSFLCVLAASMSGEICWAMVDKFAFGATKSSQNTHNETKTRFTLAEIVLESWRIWNVLGPGWFCLLQTIKQTNSKLKLPGLVLSPMILNPEFKVGTLNLITFEFGEFCCVNDLLSNPFFRLRSFEFAVEPKWRIQ